MSIIKNAEYKHKNIKKMIKDILEIPNIMFKIEQIRIIGMNNTKINLEMLVKITFEKEQIGFVFK